MDQSPTGTEAHVLGGRYVLEQQLGSGGAGVVWRAHDRVLERTVAVKLLHAEVADDHAAAARFRAEASAAAKLTHPNAVVVFDIGQTDGRDYLVMELVEGTTLADLLAHGPLPPAVVAAVGTQLGRALGAAHARGLVHRDVKPGNVLVTREGIAKLADFGIARALGEATTRLTAPGEVLATARYLAPEQLRDEPADARTDVYSLGLVLYEAVTGVPPFGEGGTVEVAMRRLTAPLVPVADYLPDVSPALEVAIARATSTAPDDRFVDGAELAGVLARLAASDAARQLARRAEEVGAGQAAPTPKRVVERKPRRTPETSAPRTSTPSDPAATAAMAVPAGEPAATAALDAAPAAPAGDTDRPPASRRTRVMLAVGALAVIGVAVALGGGLLDRRADRDTAPGELGADTLEVVDGIAIVGAGEHDPGGSGAEHPDTVGHAYDGDPSTFWRTARYRGSPELGGLKDGVGLWLDLGDRQEVAALVVATANPGATFTVYAGDAPPDGDAAPDDWGTAVAEVTDAGQEQQVVLDEPIGARVWLLWFTSLPPDGDQYRATVSEVSFVAP